ncbi:MAG: ATP-binding protein [Planctomycetota bacterium]
MSGATDEIPAASMVRPPAGSGDLESLFAAFNDVTAKLQSTHERLTGEVVRLQDELRRANDELERSRRLAALGEMAAGISHEVRNPLGSIVLYAEMLIADLADRPGEREVAGKILRSVQGLDAVVNDVLAFSREMRPEAAMVSSDDALRRAVEACGTSLAGVELELVGDVPLHADPGMLHQALVNVIRNAADAVGGSGRVTLRTRHAERNGAWAVVSVEDTGPGVAPEVVERMFNPFFTTRAAGTGLGLAIVHRIVDVHGGQVRVCNRPAAQRDGGDDPGGATFEIWLPAAADNDTTAGGRKDSGPRSAA